FLTEYRQDNQRGTREIEIKAVYLHGDEDGTAQVVPKEKWSIAVEGKSNINCEDVTIGIALSDQSGETLYATNSCLQRQQWSVAAGEHFRTEIVFPPVALAPGRYQVTIAFHTGLDAGQRCFHWWDNALEIEIPAGEVNFVGPIDLGGEFQAFTKST